MPFVQGSKREKLLITIAGVVLIAGTFFLAAFIATDPGDNLVIAEAKFAESQSGNQVVSGMVRNTTDRPYAQVKVFVELLNSEGVVIGTSSASIDILEAGSTWNFEAPMIVGGAINFRATVSSPENRRPAWLGGS